MTFTGTMDDINNALDGMVFSPIANFNGSASVQIVTNDQGNSGSGGAQSASSTVPVTVTAVNDPPVLTLPGAQTSAEDVPLTFSSSDGNAIAVTDVDAGSGSLRVILSAADGTLTLTSTSGLAFSNGTGSGDASMTFEGTLASINAALDGLTFVPDSNYNGSASISISVDDQGNMGAGGALATSGRITLNLTPVNDAPHISDPGDRYTAEDTPIAYSITSGKAITISDVDAGNGSLIVTLTAPDGLLTLGHTTGITFLIGDGVQDSVVSFSGTLTALNNALDGLVFIPNPNFNGDTRLQMYCQDQGNTGAGGPLAVGRTEWISVSGVNHAPVNQVPSVVGVQEDQQLTLSGSNLVSVSDVDAGTGVMQVTLSSTHGVLTLSGSAGLTFVTGDGTADANMTIQGTLANINAALDGMQFDPDADFHGVAQIRIVSNDLGNSGSGGALSDDDTFSVAVSAVDRRANKRRHPAHSCERRLRRPARSTCRTISAMRTRRRRR